MLEKKKKRSLLRLEVKGAGEGERRLVLAGFPVLLFFSLVFGLFYSQKFVSILPGFTPEAIQAQARKSKTYPVLVEQVYSPKAQTDQIRALSNVTAEGQGALTKAKGFHILSPHDQLVMTGRGKKGAGKKQTYKGKGPMPAGKQGDSGKGAGKPGQLKIPSNYRFRKDIALNYDGRGRLSIARQKLPGFEYFRSMLRQIRGSFAQPGIVERYRDNMGTVDSRAYTPQVVKVLFLLDKAGNVRDVRKVTPTIEQHVDDSCINSLIGQNFGPPPPEVLARGNVFGINFIFPP